MSLVVQGVGIKEIMQIVSVVVASTGFKSKTN